MPRVECVNDEQLRAYALGELSAPLIATITRHLEVCEECEAAARRLDYETDQIVRSLRRAARPMGNDASVTLPVDVTPPRPQSPASSLIGQRIAGYEVLGELGRGGMSVVYKARQAHPNRLVALKMVLVGSHASAEQRARFLAEADAIARLRHPHIVQIHEVGRHEGLPFLSLEYVGGGTLARYLGGMPQPPRQAATLVEKLARAVHHAHRQGVIHRDLKPANVLLTEDGTPKVADFGLARHDRPELTATAAVMGTPSYMAPEQAAGDSRAVGPAADIYSLGAILYECLTGRAPFRGDSNLETLQLAAHTEPVPPSELRPAVPRDLETVCLKCLEKEPAQRYATADELADDLARHLRGEPVRARPLGRVGRAWRWCRRKPALALLVTALVVALVGGTVVSSSLAWWALDEAGNAHTQAQAAGESAVQSRREQESGERQLYLARIGLLRIALNEGNLTRARQLLDATRPRDGGQDCRRVEWYYYEGVLHADLRTFQLPCAVAALAVSPDGRRVAAAGASKVVVWEVPSGHELFSFEIANFDTAYSLAFSPDGTRLACGFGTSESMAFQFTQPHMAKLGKHASGGVLIWELANGSAITNITEFGGSVLAVAFRPDGKQLAGAFCPTLFARADLRSPWTWISGQVRVWDVETGRTQVTLDWPGFDWVTFSPDGHFLLSGHRAVKVWDFAAGREFDLSSSDGRLLGASRTGRWLALGHDNDVSVILRDTEAGHNLQPLVHAAGPHTAVFSSDARKVACLGSGWVTVWEVGTGVKYYTHQAHTGLTTDTAFSDDGSVLITGGNDGFVRVWDAQRGGEPRPLPRPSNALTFTPDGRRLATDGALLDAATGRVIREFGKGRTALSPDGRWLAVVGPDLVIRVWDVTNPDKKPCRELRGATAEVYKLTVSAAGDRVGCVSGSGVSVWDLQTGEPLLLHPPPEVINATRVAFSPDCRQLASAEKNAIKVYDLETGAEDYRLEGFGEIHPIKALTYSPDGRYLASAAPFELIRIWDLKRRVEAFALEAPGYDNRIWMAFSDSGRFAAGSWGKWPDGSNVRVWELETGQETASFRVAPFAAPVALTISPDGCRVATSTLIDIKVWGMSP